MSALERYGLQPDPVIEYYKKDVDRTAPQDLELTPVRRIRAASAVGRICCDSDAQAIERMSVVAPGRISSADARKSR